MVGFHPIHCAILSRLQSSSVTDEAMLGEATDALPLEKLSYAHFEYVVPNGRVSSRLLEYA